MELVNGLISTLGVATLAMVFTMRELGVPTLRISSALKVWGIGLLFCAFQVVASVVMRVVT